MKPYRLQTDLFDPNRFTLLIWNPLAHSEGFEERATLNLMPDGKSWIIYPNNRREDYWAVKQMLTQPLGLYGETADTVAEVLYIAIFQPMGFARPKPAKQTDQTMYLF